MDVLDPQLVTTTEESSVTDKMMSHWLRDPWSPELQQRPTPDALPFWENLSSGSAWLSGLSRSALWFRYYIVPSQTRHCLHFGFLQ